MANYCYESRTSLPCVLTHMTSFRKCIPRDLSKINIVLHFKNFLKEKTSLPDFVSSEAFQKHLDSFQRVPRAVAMLEGQGRCRLASVPMLGLQVAGQTILQGPHRVQ